MNNYIEPDYEEYINEEYKDYTYNRYNPHHHRVASPLHNKRVDSSNQPGRIERQGSLLTGTFHMLLYKIL